MVCGEGRSAANATGGERHGVGCGADGRHRRFFGDWTDGISTPISAPIAPAGGGAAAAAAAAGEGGDGASDAALRLGATPSTPVRSAGALEGGSAPFLDGWGESPGTAVASPCPSSEPDAATAVPVCDGGVVPRVDGGVSVRVVEDGTAWRASSGDGDGWCVSPGVVSGDGDSLRCFFVGLWKSPSASSSPSSEWWSVVTESGFDFPVVGAEEVVLWDGGVGVVGAVVDVDNGSRLISTGVSSTDTGELSVLSCSSTTRSVWLLSNSGSNSQISS